MDLNVDNGKSIIEYKHDFYELYNDIGCTFWLWIHCLYGITYINSYFLIKNGDNKVKLEKVSSFVNQVCGISPSLVSHVENFECSKESLSIWIFLLFYIYKYKLGMSTLHFENKKALQPEDPWCFLSLKMTYCHINL